MTSPFVCWITYFLFIRSMGRFHLGNLEFPLGGLWLCKSMDQRLWEDWSRRGSRSTVLLPLEKIQQFISPWALWQVKELKGVEHWLPGYSGPTWASGAGPLLSLDFLLLPGSFVSAVCSFIGELQPRKSCQHQQRNLLPLLFQLQV